MIKNTKDDAIYTGYQGNRLSWKLKVYFNNEKYKFVFQKFNRTDPSKEQSTQGIKKKRILINEKIYFFSNLTSINVLKLPNPFLASDFLKSNSL